MITSRRCFVAVRVFREEARLFFAMGFALGLRCGAPNVCRVFISFIFETIIAARLAVARLTLHKAHKRFSLTA